MAKAMVSLPADLLAEQHSISVHAAAYAATAAETGYRLISCDHRSLVSKGLASPPS